jgi:hypothetical protein
MPLATPGHRLPQVPQLFTSLLMLTQAAPQAVYPAEQVNPHAPPLHAGAPFATPPHVFPHAPQLAASD